MEALETNTKRTFGFATPNKVTFETINYSFRLKNGSFDIIENNVDRGNFGSYASGDIFRIERNGTVVTYYRNGVLIYTSSVSSNTELTADLALITTGATIYNAYASFSCSTPTTGCDSLKIYAVKYLDESCAGNDGKVGLTYTKPYGNTVTWQWNDGSTAATRNDLSAGSYTVVGTDGNCSKTIVINIGNYCSNNAGSCITTWENTINSTFSNDILTKNINDNLWSAGGVDTNRLAASTDGWFQTEILETNTIRRFGFNSPNNSTDPDILYAIRLDAVGNFKIFEGVDNRGDFGIYNTGDIFRLEKIGTTIKYFQNGNLIYTSEIAVTTDLVPDVSLYSNNATIAKVYASFGCMPSFSGIGALVRWEALTPSVNLSLNGDSIYIGNSTSGSGRVNTAIDLDILPRFTNGWVEAEAVNLLNTQWFGLTPTNTTTSINYIKYAIKLEHFSYDVIVDGQKIYSGNNNAGDIFRIARVGHDIIFFKNSVLLTTVQTVSIPELVVDISLAYGTPGGRLLNVKSSFGNNPNPTSCNGFKIFAFDLVNESCDGNDGKAKLTYRQPHGNVSWSWSDGNTNPERTDLTQGNYSVIATSANSCQDTISVIIGNDCPSSGNACLISWDSLINVDLSNNGKTLSKNNPNNVFNASAIDYEILPLSQDGWIQTELAPKDILAFGFSAPNSNSSEIMTYSFYVKELSSSFVTEIQVRENNVKKIVTQFGTGSTNIILRIQKVGTQIRYLMNGVLVYTSEMPVSTDLVADVSFSTPNSQIYNTLASYCNSYNPCTFAVIDTINVINETCLGNDGVINLAPSGLYGSLSWQWNDGSTSMNRTGLARGLYSVTVSDTSCTDVLEVFLGSSCPPNYDSCLVTWENTIETSLSTDGKTLTKVANNDNWTAGGIDTDTLPYNADGFVEMEVLETNTFRLFGLSSPNSIANTIITYAFRLRNTGEFEIIENGTTNIGNFGNYSSGDIFKIERVGTAINYLYNGNLIHTSTITSTTDLVADCVIRTFGGTIYKAYASYGCSNNPCDTLNLQSSIATLGADTCSNNTGYVSVISNQSNINYLWSDNNSTTPNRVGLAAGNYTLITTHNPTNCKDTLDITIISINNNCNTGNNYKINDLTQTCEDNFFCLPITAINAVPNGILGLDISLDYDAAIMEPTGIVTLGSVANNGGTAGYNLTANNGTVFLGIFYTSSVGSYLTGAGEIACIQFRLLHTDSTQVGNYPIIANNITEAYDPNINPIIDVNTTADAGGVTLTNSINNLLNGRIIYHNDMNNPVINNTGGSVQTLINTAINNSGNCSLGNSATQYIGENAPQVQWGYFQLPMSGGNEVSIVRDIPDTTIVMDIINGSDGVATWRIIDGTNTPTIYELLAADVNGSGSINSGDITLIHQRAAMSITTYPNGMKDWLFVSDELLTQNNFITTNNGGIANQFNVPTMADCIPVQAIGSGCSRNEENMHAVLVGDVNGSWNNVNNGATKTNEALIVDVNNAVDLGNNTYQIPVYYNSPDVIEAIDFNLDYDENIMVISNVATTNTTQNAQFVWNNYNDLQTERLLLSASIVNGIQTSEVVFYIEVTTNTVLKDYHFGANSFAYLNGKAVTLSVIGTTNTNEQTGLERINIYPNPFKNNLIIDYKAQIEKVETLDLYHINGIYIRSIDINNTGQSTINTEDLTSGVYIIAINNQQYIKVVKVD